MASRVGLSRRRQEPTCINDPHKTAKYLTYSEEETLYYCEKCAILLASQGFSVAKLPATGDSFDGNPRKEEIDCFLAELEVVMAALVKKQQGVNSNLACASQIYREEEAKVEEYYGHFYEIIDELKRRVLEELKEEYENGVKESGEARGRLENALGDSKRMKDDIVDSMNIILNESEEEQFRPIMNNYQQNLRDYKNLTNKLQLPPIAMRRLDFKDPEVACNALEEGLQIHWEEKQDSEMGYSKQSDCPENPVEVIETEEKFTKSSLKEIGNLFSSFD